jgi:hypothetical protein
VTSLWLVLVPLFLLLTLGQLEKVILDTFANVAQNVTSNEKDNDTLRLRFRSLRNFMFFVGLGVSVPSTASAVLFVVWGSMPFYYVFSSIVLLSASVLAVPFSRFIRPTTASTSQAAKTKSTRESKKFSPQANENKIAIKETS